MHVTLMVKSSVLVVAIAGGVLVGTLGERLAQAHSDGSPVSVHKYQTNANGQTYGSDAWIPGGTVGLSDEPDLIKAQATNGKIGYVKSSDLYGPMPKTPQQAVALDAKNKNPRTIPVYASDGTSVIGSFVISGKAWENKGKQWKVIN